MIGACEMELPVSSVTTGRTFFFFLPVRLSVMTLIPYMNTNSFLRDCLEVLFIERVIFEPCIRQ